MPNTQLALENLLLLLFQAGAKLRIADGKLLVSPPNVANFYAAQIKRLKPEIAKHLDCCPVCLALLDYEHRQQPYLTKEGSRWIRATQCSVNPSHFNGWKVI